MLCKYFQEVVDIDEVVGLLAIKLEVLINV